MLVANIDGLPPSPSSPVNICHFSYLLRPHPDALKVQRVLSGLQFGFDIGVEGLVGPGSCKNNSSALECPKLVSDAIQRELSDGSIWGPFTSPPMSPFHCSPVSAAAKPNGSVRLILDMSSPRGDALNEFIDKDRFVCKYSSFDDALRLLIQVGRGAYMAKLDIKNAFRLCPVQPRDWWLLGFKWDGKFYVYLKLPYGSRSSPAIFNDFADLLCWVFCQVNDIPQCDHYLDDYFLVGGSLSTCDHYLAIAKATCQYLGVPLALDKVVGPATSITYLGILIDSVSFTIMLPDEKLSKLKALLHGWTVGKSCSKRDLLSLIGFLSFACKHKAWAYVFTAFN